MTWMEKKVASLFKKKEKPQIVREVPQGIASFSPMTNNFADSITDYWDARRMATVKEILAQNEEIVRNSTLTDEDLKLENLLREIEGMQR